MKHAAIIEIDSRLLTEILDFKGGIIHRVYTKDEYIAPQPTFYMVIEHPDLPEVPDNEMLPQMTPVLQSSYSKEGLLIKIERVDPPKQNDQKIKICP